MLSLISSHVNPTDTLCLRSPNGALPAPGLGKRDKNSLCLAKGPEMLIGFFGLTLCLLGSLTLQEEGCQENLQPLLLQMPHTQPGWDWWRDSMAGRRY